MVDRTLVAPSLAAIDPARPHRHDGFWPGCDMGPGQDYVFYSCLRLCNKR
jgi:hypothetical protein